MRVNPVFSGSAKIAPSFTRNYSANDAQAIAQIFREHKSRIDGWPKNVSVEIHSAGERGNAWENGDLHAFAKIKVGRNVIGQADYDTRRSDGERTRSFIERILNLTEALVKGASEPDLNAFGGKVKIDPSFTNRFAAQDAKAIVDVFSEHQERVNQFPKGTKIEIHGDGERGNAWENGNLHAFAKIKVGAHSFDRGDQDLWRQDGESIRKYVERLIRFVEETHEFL